MLGGKNRYWLADAVFVVAGVFVDTEGRSEFLFLLPGVLPGFRYAWCEQVLRINAHRKEPPMANALCFRSIKHYQGPNIMQATLVLPQNVCILYWA